MKVMDQQDNITVGSQGAWVQIPTRKRTCQLTLEKLLDLIPQLVSSFD